LVQVTLKPPVPLTAAPVVTSTLPNASGVVETAQLDVTFAETDKVELASAAKAGAAETAARKLPAKAARRNAFVM
jgi:hypothetical protein